MKVCNNYQSLIIDVASGAAGEGDRLCLEEHIVTCESCAAEFARTNSIVSIACMQPKDPGDAYWDGYYGRLAERMESEASRGTSSEMLPERTSGGALRLGLQSLTEFLFPRQRWALQLAVAVLLVATGVLFGRSVFAPSSDSTVLANNDADAGLLQQAALEVRAHKYLDRSKTLLLGLVNFNVGEDDPGTLNFERRQAMAGELVLEASFLQDQLSPTDQRRLRELIADLEVILLQIANIESAYDVPEIEIVQSGVDRKAILFKIEIEEMRRFDAAPSETRRAPANSAI